MATFSATFTGWLTCASGLKMPEPRWMCGPWRGRTAEADVVRPEVRVLLQEVVLGRPGVLEAGLVRLDDDSVSISALCSAERVGLGALAHVSLYKEPEFQGGSPSPVCF